MSPCLGVPATTITLLLVILNRAGIVLSQPYEIYRCSFEDACASPQKTSNGGVSFDNVQSKFIGYIIELHVSVCKIC